MPVAMVDLLQVDAAKGEILVEKRAVEVDKEDIYARFDATFGRRISKIFNPEIGWHERNELPSLLGSNNREMQLVANKRYAAYFEDPAEVVSPGRRRTTVVEGVRLRCSDAVASEECRRLGCFGRPFRYVAETWWGRRGLKLAIVEPETEAALALRLRLEARQEVLVVAGLVEGREVAIVAEAFERKKSPRLVGLVAPAGVSACAKLRAAARQEVQQLVNEKRLVLALDMDETLVEWHDSLPETPSRPGWYERDGESCQGFAYGGKIVLLRSGAERYLKPQHPDDPGNRVKIYVCTAAERGLARDVIHALVERGLCSSDIDTNVRVVSVRPLIDFVVVFGRRLDPDSLPPELRRELARNDDPATLANRLPAIKDLAAVTTVAAHTGAPLPEDGIYAHHKLAFACDDNVDKWRDDRAVLRDERAATFRDDSRLTMYTRHLAASIFSRTRAFALPVCDKPDLRIYDEMRSLVNHHQPDRFLIS